VPQLEQSLLLLRLATSLRDAQRRLCVLLQPGLDGFLVLAAARRIAAACLEGQIVAKVAPVVIVQPLLLALLSLLLRPLQQLCRQDSREGEGQYRSMQSRSACRAACASSTAVSAACSRAGKAAPEAGFTLDEWAGRRVHAASVLRGMQGAYSLQAKVSSAPAAEVTVRRRRWRPRYNWQSSPCRRNVCNPAAHHSGQGEQWQGQNSTPSAGWCRTLLLRRPLPLQQHGN
jgi:hypothetical protein